MLIGDCLRTRANVDPILPPNAPDWLDLEPIANDLDGTAQLLLALATHANHNELRPDSLRVISGLVRDGVGQLRTLLAQARSAGG